MTTPSTQERRQVTSRSVVDRPSTNEVQGFAGRETFWWVVAAAQSIEAWGRRIALRDRQLRAFLTTEPVLNSAISSVVARNIGFDWRLTGPPRQTDVSYDLLHNANNGLGWANLISKFSWDFYCQDKGAFIEIIREEDNERAPTIGLQHLDAGRCWHTGNPDVPVIYRDRRDRWHEMKWHQIITVGELPAPHEILYGLQYSAMTRVLKAAQIMANVLQHHEEKTGGRHTKAIHIISGINPEEIQAAIEQRKDFTDAQGQTRFMLPAILTNYNPVDKIDHVVLDLMGTPDGWDMKEWQIQYLTILSMGLLTDYQELAPLPGGNLGTSTQSEVLQAKGRGKGAAIFRKVVASKLNTSGVLPQDVEFEFEEQDLGEDRAEADNRKLRAEARELDIASMVITPEIGRQIMVDDGDLSQEQFDAMGQVDVTGQSRMDTDAAMTEEAGLKQEFAGPSEERLSREEELAAELEDALKKVQTRIGRRLRQED